MSAKIIFGDMETLYIKFALMKNTIAIVEAGFSGTQGLDLCSRHDHAGNIGAFKEIIVGCLAVRDLQVSDFFAKILV